MAYLTTQAIVLRYANYRDHDRMLTLLSPAYGRLDVLSRGCRRPKSPFLTTSELFVHGEFVLYRRNGGENDTLTSCAVAETFYPLRLDAYRLTCASYLLGLSQAAAQPDEAAESLFALLLKGLYTLAYTLDDPPLPVVAAFLMLYACLLGYRPRLNHCVRCRAPIEPDAGAWFDVEGGGLCCDACRGDSHTYLNPKEIQWLRSLRGTQLPESYPDENSATRLFLLLRRYVEARIDTPIRASRLLP